MAGLAAVPAVGAKVEREECRVANLLCEYLVNPLGIDETQPRLSWQLAALEANARGLKQSAFQILAASEAALLQQNKGDLWDSGRVGSDQSIHVVYAGKPLRSRMSCFWKVRVWDQNGKASAWSEPAQWSMGLLEPEDWSGEWIGLDEPLPATAEWFPGAQWIWYPEGNPREEAPLGRRFFQCEFTLPGGPAVAAASLYAIADAGCVTFVNGKPAGEGGPVRTDDCWKKPEALDVRGLLKAGQNLLTVEAENTGRIPYTPGHRSNPAGLIALLKVRFENGLEWTLPTSRTWSAAQRSDAGPTEWRSAMELGAFGTAPWNRVGPDEYRVLPGRLLRREFEIRGGIKSATAYISGLGYSELFLNGRRVGDHVMGPVLSDYEKKVHYLTYDVTGHLRQGVNAAGIVLGNGAFFSYRKNVPAPFRTFGYPKALLNIRLVRDDGTIQDIVTDADWKVTAEGPIRANNEYDGEIYDARREQAGWSAANFDEAAWRPAQLVEAPTGKMTAQKLEPLRVTETLRPKEITEPRPGVFVVDFGETFNGWVRLNVSGPAGTEVRMRRAGILRPDGMIRRDDSRSALMTDVYVLSGRGRETWSPRFSTQGGRYVEVLGFPGRPKVGSFEGLVVHTDMNAAGTFECSNELATRLFQVMRLTQRIEARGVPLDCSTRDERMPWISEHHGMDGHGYTYQVAAMYTNWLEDIRRSQRANGSIPNVAPSFWTFGDGVVWPVTLFYLPNWFHRFYGDRRAVERNYPAMKRLIRFMQEKYLKPDGTIDYNDNGDWLDATTMDGSVPNDGRSHPFVGATPQPLISSSFFYLFCTILQQHARLLGRAADAEAFAQLGAKVRDGFQRRFFDAATNSYERGTQTSYVLPLAFGLVPDERRAAVAQNLANDVMVKHEGYTTCGFMGVQWILTVLSETGHHDAAWSILTRTARPSWGYMLAKGSTTMWERWDHDTADPTMTGESQYFLGAGITGWLFQSLAGINPDEAEPGFKRVVLRPVPVGDLAWVKASFKSLYGPIASAWKIAGDRITWDVTVPPNTMATAFVPTTRAGSVSDVGKGARHLRSEAGAEVFEVSAGTYHFEAEWKK